MKKSKKAIFAIAVIFAFSNMYLFGQLPQNTNFQWGSKMQSSFFASSDDWLLGVLSLNSGDFLATGYASGATRHPIIIKKSSTGTTLFEQTFTCIDGIGTNVYEHPNGYLIVGRGAPSSVGCAADPEGMFAMLVDPTTGAINTGWGVRYYNERTVGFPLPQNAATSTIIGELTEGKTRGCALKSASGQTKGYFICGNYNDGSWPTNSQSIQNYATGCFIIQIDLHGRPVASFGNGGIGIYLPNASGTYYNAHIMDLCVDYDASGNPQGLIAVGHINQQTNLVQINGNVSNDAFMMKLSLSGALVSLDIFDDLTHWKNTGTPVSYPYTDAPETAICLSNGWSPPYYTGSQDNDNERATRVTQKINGGPFVVLCQYDWNLWNYSSPCTQFFPTSGTKMYADPVVIEVDAAGNFTWSKNVYHSTGQDFENDLLVDNTTIIVLGSTQMEPDPGTPLYQHAVISKLDLMGNILMEEVYVDNSSGTTRICPFAFDLDGTGGVIIVGDSKPGTLDDFQFIHVNPY